LTKELGKVKEEGAVLILGGYERRGHIVIKGEVYEGGDLTLRGLLAIEKERYQRMTQQRSVTCPECAITLSIPKDQETFLCPKCKKEWKLQLSEEEKKFDEFKEWNVGFAFWAEEQTLRDKVKDFFASITEKMKEKPETVVGPAGIIDVILRAFGK